MYINDFLLISNIIILLEKLKKCLAKKFNIENLEEVKMIIRWQIDRDIALDTIKIYQSAFIKDFVIEKNLTNCNTNIILIKVGFVIDIGEFKDYEKTNL